MIKKIGQVLASYRDLLKSEFFKNVSILMTGSVISQIIPYFSAPIISRLYSPEDYAVVAAYNSITVLLTIVATGMYSSALMVDKTDEIAFNTGAAAFIVTIFITLISLIVFLTFNKIIAGLTGNENITFWLYLIPLTVFFTGGYQTLNMWNNRKKRYKRLAGNKIFQSIIISGATLIMGFLSYHSTGLMISMLLGQIISFGLLFFQTIKEDKIYIRHLSFSSIKNSFKVHQDFPKYNMPQGFLDGFRESSIVLIISNYFGQVVLGSYSFAMVILNKPIQVIGSSFNQVFYQRASDKFNDGSEIWTLTKKTTLLLFIISLPISSVLVFWGGQIFKFVFGPKWEQAGFYAQILSIWILSRFIISALSGLPLILKKQKRFFQLSLMNNLLPPFTLLLSSILIDDIFVVLLLFVIVNLLIIAIMFYWILNISAFAKS